MKIMFDLCYTSYWDEPRDVGNFNGSVILDPVTGFGGNGTGPKNCIHDGPFVNYTNSIGPNHMIADHCIDRIVSEEAGAQSDQKYVDECYKLQNFSSAWPCIEEKPHKGGHGGIGGQACFSPMFRVIDTDIQLR